MSCGRLGGEWVLEHWHSDMVTTPEAPAAVDARSGSIFRLDDLDARYATRHLNWVTLLR